MSSFRRLFLASKPALHRNLKVAGALLAALPLVLSATSAQAAPLAVLSDVVGKVQVVHGKKTSNAKTGMGLDAGDVVQVVSGSATIFYPSRAPQTLKAGNSATIGSTTETGTGQTTAWKGLYTGLSSGFARRTQTKAFAVRGSKIDTAPCPLVPAGLIATPRPTLVWVAPKTFEKMGVKGYELYLFGAKGKLIWRTTTTNTFVAYPETAPALESGVEYVWQVTPILAKQKNGAEVLRVDADNKSVGLWFRFASPEVGTQAQAEVVRLRGELGDASPVTQRLAEAAALRRFGLDTAALTTLMPQIFDPMGQPESQPSSPLVWPVFREAHAQLDEASQVLVNALAETMDKDSG